MWDVWIHILEIAAECACWGDGRPSVPPLRQKRGKPGRRAESSRPTKGVAGTWPLIRPSVRTGAPSPQGEGLGKTKRDRSGTCPLKRRGEAELRRKFFWFLFFQEKELLTFFFKESRQLGKVLYEMQENFAEISTFLTGGTVAKAGRLW